jgi:Helix-turn-helix domain
MDTTFKLIPETEYNKLAQKLDLIIKRLPSEAEASGEGTGRWATEKRAQEMLGKKATTLWKMRNQGRLAFTKINNKVFYDRESILALLEANRREAFGQKTTASHSNLKNS